MDVAAWLRGLGLGQYALVFRDNDIDEEVLRRLTAEDLRDLGVASIGHRRRLLDAIVALGEGQFAEGRQSAPETRDAAREAERRHLTVMFCDLVGSTSLSSRLDPEDLREVIAAYHRAVAEVVACFDGFVSRFMGDGVLVYFGYPQAHEDDAERAVLAGLGAIAAVGRLDVKSIKLQARVGIATGLVVVGDLIGEGSAQEQTVVGETPNLAARMQGIAEPNSEVIAESTRRLVGDMFELEDLGTKALKGIAAPVPVWAALRPSSAESRFDALHGGRLTALVGREEELDLLLRRWSRAKAGEGQVVLLSGEAGIGKSRLTAALLECLAGEPQARLRYSCSPHHTHSPLYPFITQLEAAAGFKPGSGAGQKFDRLKALLRSNAANAERDVALIAELLGVPTDESYPPLAISPQQKREMTLNALLDHLEGMAARGPVLIVFEDVHWIDPTSQDLLDRILARVASLPVLLASTFRPEFEPVWVGEPHVTMLPLSRLGRRDSAVLIAGITGDKALPDAVVEQILSHTDGVPLFIEELTRALLESGLLHETTDRYVLDRPLPHFAVPTTLQASLVARLDRLGPAREVAQIGAAIGREFAHELVAAVSASVPTDLDSSLGRLVSSGLVSRRGTPPDETYAFKHALVQDAAYGTLLRSRRQQLHASIARALVERFPAMAESRPEVVAHHFTEASLAAEAVGYWRKAGQLSSARSASREAVSSFERALSLLEGLTESMFTLEQGFEIRLELRSSLLLLGEGRRLLERLREAEVLAERLNDDHRRGHVCAFITRANAIFGELDEAVAVGTRTLELARRVGDVSLRMLGTIGLEQAHYYRGDYARVVELAIDNLTAAPVGESVHSSFMDPVPPPIYDRFWLVFSLAQLGQFAEATEYETEAIQLAETARNPHIIGMVHYAAGTHHVIEGDWTKARAMIERGIAVSRMANIDLLLAHLVASSAWALAQLGETSEALNRLREGEQLLDRQASRGFVLAWTYQALGRACLLLGRLDESRRLADRAMESSPRHPGYAAHAVHLLGDIATHPDRFDAGSGELHYRKSLMLAEARGMRPLVAHCHLGLGKLYRRAGPHTQAQKHIRTAITMYGDIGMTYWLEQAEAEMHHL
jgi:class 3 adenylate cyclase/tetratricopeptide (TPR) repeat protein